jgi:hypothetical protein
MLLQILLHIEGLISVACCAKYFLDRLMMPLISEISHARFGSRHHTFLINKDRTVIVELDKRGRTVSTHRPPHTPQDDITWSARGCFAVVLFAIEWSLSFHS